MENDPYLSLSKYSPLSLQPVLLQLCPVKESPMNSFRRLSLDLDLPLAHQSPVKKMSGDRFIANRR